MTINIKGSIKAVRPYTIHVYVESDMAQEYVWYSLPLLQTYTGKVGGGSAVNLEIIDEERKQKGLVPMSAIYKLAGELLAKE